MVVENVEKENVGKESDAIDTLSFEEALARLEKNVKMLEGGNLTLDEAVNLFEVGNKLQAHCEKKLNEVKLKIEKISQNAAQNNVVLEPFDFHGA
jgi:exodeoxyribonuclease VII small subunit